MRHGAGPDQRRLALAFRRLNIWALPPQGPHRPRVHPPLPKHAGGGVQAVVASSTGLAPPELVTRFESLGFNCEFGLLQRRLGAEPLGLLRFAGLDMPGLLQGLETAFHGIDDAQGLELGLAELDGRPEYLLRAARYAARFHTNAFRDEQPDPRPVIARTERYLRFLQRHFAGTMAAGERIFVLHHEAVTSPATALPVLARLAAWAPNKLLYVTRDAVVPAGSVRQETDHLFHGFTDRLMTPLEPWRMNVDAWLSICANTLLAAGHPANNPSRDIG